MPFDIDETHDPDLQSWVKSANDPETGFPIQNLPLGRYEELDDDGDPTGENRVVCAIGSEVLDLSAMHNAGLIDDVELDIDEDDDFDLVDLEGPQRQQLRLMLSLMLRDDAPTEVQERVSECLVTESPSLVPTLPFDVTDYTDFYASVFHATNVGSMFRPDNPLLPNYKHLPVGYHGRASTLVVSGTQIRRPCGQTLGEGAAAPTFGPCKLLDYELEVGVFVCPGNERGESIPIGDADDHLFGLCLVNDWSARDIQKWEYQPLGPFLAKSFATTVSPWVVTMEALAPFRAPAYERPASDPTPLPHLYSRQDQAAGGIDLTLEVVLASEKMRKAGHEPISLSKASFRDMYWTFAQMLAHHASNGCEMADGDLIASGTVSGPSRANRGCLLELTWDGDPWANPPSVVPGTQRTPFELPTGEKRTFLSDGDEVIIRGWCERDGYRRIGLGECRGIITPAVG